MNETRSKLQEKVTEMENFAGHLEEIFLTVEVKVSPGTQDDHKPSPQGFFAFHNVCFVFWLPAMFLGLSRCL